MQHEGRLINKRRWRVVYRIPDGTCDICGEYMSTKVACPFCKAEMCEACAEGHWCPEPEVAETDVD